MYAYRHHFHAGNFADVFKHALLSQLILTLKKKDRPFVYVDTHAGLGVYDLSHPWAGKNKEYAFGVSRIFSAEDYPEKMEAYLSVLKQQNDGDVLSCYPGSPVVARSLLRPQDRLVLNELNKSDSVQLKALTKNWSRTSIRNEDGFSLTNSVLPPSERRGLVFMDPSYDRKDEFSRIAASLEVGLRKFASGVFVVWYPVIDGEGGNELIKKLQLHSSKLLLQAEIHLSNANFAGRMNACGLLIINPPYQFESVVNIIGCWILKRLDPTGNGSIVNRLLTTSLEST